MPHAFPVAPRVITVSSTRSGLRPMMTALPPPTTTSSAVCRPMPLLPPTTTSLRLVNASVMTNLHPIGSPIFRDPNPRCSSLLVPT